MGVAPPPFAPRGWSNTTADAQQVRADTDGIAIGAALYGCQLAFTGPPHGAAQSLRAPPRRGRPFRPLSSVVRFLEIPQQPLDIFELELRTEVLAEAPAQFLENAPRALHIDLARHLDRSIVAVVAPAQGPAERVGLLLGARQPEPAALAVRAGTQHPLLLHRLGERLRSSTQSFAGAALRGDGAVRVAFSQLPFRIAHGIAGAAELIHLALPLLTLAQALLAQLLHQLLELIAQGLLILAQLAHLVALLALLALLT